MRKIASHTTAAMHISPGILGALLGLVAPLAGCSGQTVEPPVGLPVMDHGTIVVYVVSKSGKSIAVAAESRLMDLNNAPVGGDHACKIIELSNNALFFASGQLFKRLPSGQEWSGEKEARQAFVDAETRGIASVADQWKESAKSWFEKVPPDALGPVGRDGGIVNAGFLRFEDGLLVFKVVKIQLVGDPVHVIGVAQTIAPGIIEGGYGLAENLAKEFLDGESVRAIKAPEKWPKQKTKAEADAIRAEAAVQFAIDHAAELSGWEKDAIGGPIDVALLELGRPVRWIKRKPECDDKTR